MDMHYFLNLVFHQTMFNITVLLNSLLLTYVKKILLLLNILHI